MKKRFIFILIIITVSFAIFWFYPKDYIIVDANVKANTTGEISDQFDSYVYNTFTKSCEKTVISGYSQVLYRTDVSDYYCVAKSSTENKYSVLYVSKDNVSVIKPLEIMPLFFSEYNDGFVYQIGKNVIYFHNGIEEILFSNAYSMYFLKNNIGIYSDIVDKTNVLYFSKDGIEKVVIKSKNNITFCTYYNDTIIFFDGNIAMQYDCNTAECEKYNYKTSLVDFQLSQGNDNRFVILSGINDFLTIDTYYFDVKTKIKINLYLKFDGDIKRIKLIEN